MRSETLKEKLGLNCGVTAELCHSALARSESDDWPVHTQTVTPGRSDPLWSIIPRHSVDERVAKQTLCKPLITIGLHSRFTPRGQFYEAFLVSKKKHPCIRPVTRGGSGGSSEPPLLRTPLPKIRTPPPHKPPICISDIDFKACPSPLYLLRLSIHDRPLPTPLRTPFNIPPKPPIRSNRLNTPKDRICS